MLSRDYGGNPTKIKGRKEEATNKMCGAATGEGEGRKWGGKPAAAPLLPDSVSLLFQDLLILHYCTGRVKRPIGLLSLMIKLFVYHWEHYFRPINSRVVIINSNVFKFHQENVAGISFG